MVVISASRSVRTGLLPLWADHVGISASTTSLIFALAAAIDIAFFYPGGWLMDHRGRAVVAVPVVAAVAVACFLLPFTSGAAGVAGVMVLIAVGNGLGSGIVMTLGADTAPTVGRAQYLGGWRLCGDIGNSGGPLLVGAVAAVAPLAAACVVIGVLGAARHRLGRLLDPPAGPTAADGRSRSADGDADLVGDQVGVGVDHPELVRARPGWSGRTS